MNVNYLYSAKNTGVLVCCQTDKRYRSADWLEIILIRWLNSCIRHRRYFTIIQMNKGMVSTVWQTWFVLLAINIWLVNYIYFWSQNGTLIQFPVGHMALVKGRPLLQPTKNNFITFSAWNYTWTCNSTNTILLKFQSWMKKLF